MLDLFQGVLTEPRGVLGNQGCTMWWLNVCLSIIKKYFPVRRERERRPALVLETVEEALAETHVQHLLVVLGLKWDQSMIEKKMPP